ncbi:pyridoxamine 5'-phosphate oxidase family protein [Kitasatospora sp. NPDC094015]|uniref:helix-turn-helix domain-containing protein n=1 Tax=Kitasatospora sp. NPDC094015 TaxID=3155205 RepID=UPI0033171712
MPQTPGPGSAEPPAQPSAEPPVDLAAVRRRIADTRDRLGIGEPELAKRAGMDPRYLRRVTEAGPQFDADGLRRVAAALGVDYRDLLDGPADPSPGHTGRPAGHPPGQAALLRLTEQECWQKVGPRGIGRIAVAAAPSPLVVPVNYATDAGTVVYRTAPGGVAALAPGTRASFQVDRIDDRTGTGWSVLVTGTAERIEDPEAVRTVERHGGAEPWAGGKRPLWIRIRPQGITGRRIGTVGPDGHLT